MIKAVFFDFDGVILESSKIKTEAFPLVFEEYPHLQDEILKYHLQHQGISRFEKFRYFYRELLNEHLSEKQEKELGLRFSEIVFQKVMEAEFVPGVLSLLNYLQKK